MDEEQAFPEPEDVHDLYRHCHLGAALLDCRNCCELSLLQQYQP